MLKIAMIAPIQVMGIANKFSEVEMTLFHLFKDREIPYAEALQKRTRVNPVILDNSFFELGKPASVEEMSALLKKPYGNLINKIILPDGDFSALDFLGDELPCDLILVPTSVEELVAALKIVQLKYFTANPRPQMMIGISCIHAQKALKIEKFTQTTRDSFVEAGLKHFNADFAEKIRRGNYLHFLGLNNQPWAELFLLGAKYNASLDSSAFVWPFLKYKLDIRGIEDKFTEPVDFDTTWSFYTQGVLEEYLRSVVADLERNNIIAHFNKGGI